MPCNCMATLQFNYTHTYHSSAAVCKCLLRSGEGAHTVRVCERENEVALSLWRGCHCLWWWWTDCFSSSCNSPTSWLLVEIFSILASNLVTRSDPSQLPTTYSVIDHWIPSIHHWILSIHHWILSIHHWIPSVHHWIPSIHHWIPSIHHWISSIT